MIEYDRTDDMWNWVRYNVRFERAKEVFDDKRAVLFLDPAGAKGEDVYALVGKDFETQRLLVCRFSDVSDVLRIKSAREARAKEIALYKEVRHES